MKKRIPLLLFILLPFVIINVTDARTQDAPTCVITSPTDGAGFDFGDSLKITANASDPDGSIASVSFYVDSELQYSDENQPYEYTWNTVRNTIGSRSIKAVAIDNEGLSGIDSIAIQILLNSVQNYTYEIINEYPHDENAFIQGLVWENDTLYEGTGRTSRSSVRKVQLETGDVLQIHNLDDDYWGEGIAIFDNRIIQLTYRKDISFVYDKKSFAVIDTFSYETSTSEGWGITHDGEKLIVSDGSSNLYFWDPGTYEEIGQVTVMEDDDSVANLNELEFFYNKVFANVHRTDHIVMIDLASGKVVGKLDCTDILGSPKPNNLNGIAYDRDNDRIFVTGKLWPKLFEIKLIPIQVSNTITDYIPPGIASKSSPNPFRNIVTINYSIPGNNFVTIKVFNLKGKAIRVLQRGKQLKGTHFVTWDGKSKKGKKVPCGHYYYQIVYGENKSTEKILLIR